MPSPWFHDVDAMRALTVRWWSMDPIKNAKLKLLKTNDITAKAALPYHEHDPGYVPPIPHPTPEPVVLEAKPARILWAILALSAVNAVSNVVILFSL